MALSPPDPLQAELISFSLSTEDLALWGAVTGTVGTLIAVGNLLLRVREHLIDRPKLRAQFVAPIEGPPGDETPTPKIEVANLGRRDVTLDHIVVFMRPPPIIPRIFKRYHWKRGKWKYSARLDTAITLSEGKKTNQELQIPDGLKPSEIFKIHLIDQTNQRWAVRLPTIRKVRRLTRHEVYEDKTITEAFQSCSIKQYAVGLEYRISITVTDSSKPSNTARIMQKYFYSKKEAQQAMKTLLDETIPKLMAGTLSFDDL